MTEHGPEPIEPTAGGTAENPDPDASSGGRGKSRARNARKSKKRRRSRTTKPTAAAGTVGAAPAPARGKRPGNGGKPPRNGPTRGGVQRVSNAEVSARIATVLDLIVSGICRRGLILRTLAKNYGEGKITWGPAGVLESEPGPRADGVPTFTVSQRTVDLYIARATAQLQASADEPRHVAKSKARARYEKALAGAVSAKQWDTVRKVNRDLVRLDGLEPGVGVRVTHDGTVNTNVSGEVEHVHRGVTLEERASAITDLLGLAVARRAQKVQNITTVAAGAIGSPESN